MTDKKDRKGEESVTPGMAGQPAEAARERRPEPASRFARAHNDYFRAMYEIQRLIQTKTQEAYRVYSKAVQEAMESRSCEALRQANEQLCTALADACNPAYVRDGVGRAFEAYQRDLKAAFASEDAASLEPANLSQIAQSMAVVSFHRLVHRGV